MSSNIDSIPLLAVLFSSQVTKDFQREVTILSKFITYNMISPEEIN